MLAYEIDIHGHHEHRFVPKLTDEHIDEKKLKKMSVPHCMEMLSNTVAARIENLATKMVIFPKKLLFLIGFKFLKIKLVCSKILKMP